MGSPALVSLPQSPAHTGQAGVSSSLQGTAWEHSLKDPHCSLRSPQPLLLGSREASEGRYGGHYDFIRVALFVSALHSGVSNKNPRGGVLWAEGGRVLKGKPVRDK